MCVAHAVSESETDEVGIVILCLLWLTDNELDDPSKDNSEGGGKKEMSYRFKF